MTKRTLLQAVFFFLSIAFLTGFWVNNHQSLFQTTAEKFENPWDKCERGALCKGVVDESHAKNQTKCKPAGYEGCLIDYRDDQGNFCFAVRQPDCGKKEKEKPPRRKTPTPTPTPTVTPTPTPTITPTPTPTVTPGPTPTPTPTPTPPQVLGAEAPKVLPKTGFPGQSLLGLSVFAGSLGWFLLRRAR